MFVFAFLICLRLGQIFVKSVGLESFLGEDLEEFGRFSGFKVLTIFNFHFTFLGVLGFINGGKNNGEEEGFK